MTTIHLNFSKLKFKFKLKFNTCRDSSTFIFSYLPLLSYQNRQDSKSLLMVTFLLPLDMRYFRILSRHKYDGQLKSWESRGTRGYSNYVKGYSFWNKEDSQLESSSTKPCPRVLDTENDSLTP